MKYVGQTGRSFRIRFQEHRRDFKHNNAKSKFAAHLLENDHSIGKINDIMDILYITKKCRTLDTIERYYIYNETKNGTEINGKNTVNPNRIHEAVLQGAADRLRMHGTPNTDPPKASTSPQYKASILPGPTYQTVRYQTPGHTPPGNVLHSPTTGLLQRPHHKALIYPGYIRTSTPQDTTYHQ